MPHIAYLLSTEEVYESPRSGYQDSAASLQLPQLMTHTGATIYHHRTVDGVVHKFPGLSVYLHGELPGGGDNEHPRALLLSCTGPRHILPQHASDDRQEKCSLKW